MRPDQYTIAWICALHFELAAAMAMLDETHDKLPTEGDDTNAYTLGRIGQHNVVIACLPVTQYGTNNAAIVSTHLSRTFTNIRFALMVGIGGAAPGQADVRLGDVVVGTRVMQHDLGKVVEDGHIETTASAKPLSPTLGTFISTLRALHELQESRIPSILKEKTRPYPEYQRPTTLDRLFKASYQHGPEYTTCDRCDSSELVPRSRRKSRGPMIHYGGIGSGNQVIKSGTMRDRVARKLDIICFEMEAVGLWDVLPCLPIRGICDYSDSHKNKQWQRYAAATAAAYAREFLDVLPTGASHPETQASDTSMPPDQNLRQISQDEAKERLRTAESRRRKLLKSLAFRRMSSRESEIKRADASTCRWFLDHPGYKAWCDPKRLGTHQGLLWMRGKPGAGKSTLVKFLYSELFKARTKDSVIASFFFNARGERLEYSVNGLYRALLLQVLEGFPDVQSVLDDQDLLSPSRDSCNLVELKDLFFAAVTRLGSRSLTCIVDALDESDEQQVMDMIEYFETVCEHTSSHNISFRVLFSSRHYPYIDIRVGIRVILEHQGGHAQDLEVYVRKHLRIADPILFESLLQKILDKASGVFLWVHLVIGLLNKESRRGGLAVKKKLADVPPDLKGLFLSILTRDNEDKDALLLSIIWILFSHRPLTPAEYYHALWSGLRLKGKADDELPDASNSQAEKSIKSSIISYSKGLAEITWLEKPRDHEAIDDRRVQFIHESVRDFLIKDKGIHDLWENLGYDWQNLSHDRLKACCHMYLHHHSVRGHVTRILKDGQHQSVARAQLVRMCPLISYANENVLWHSNRAAETVSQGPFLGSFDLGSFVTDYNLLAMPSFEPKTSLLYVLSHLGLENLIHLWPHNDHHSQKSSSKHIYPMFAALLMEKTGAVAALLDSSDDLGLDDIVRKIKNSQISEFAGSSPLHWCVKEGLTAIVRILLKQGASVSERSMEGQTVLDMALYRGQIDLVTLLIDHGADVNELVDLRLENQTPLAAAIEQRMEAMALLLIERGARVNGRPFPLVSAARANDFKLARLLVDKGAEINIRTNDPPLLYALKHHNIKLASLLIEKGADIHHLGLREFTPLGLAVLQDCEPIASALLRMGADVNAPDDLGYTPLDVAFAAYRPFNSLTEGYHRSLHLPAKANQKVRQIHRSSQPISNVALPPEERTILNADVNALGTKLFRYGKPKSLKARHPRVVPIYTSQQVGAGRFYSSDFPRSIYSDDIEPDPEWLHSTDTRNPFRRSELPKPKAADRTDNRMTIAESYSARQYAVESLRSRVLEDTDEEGGYNSASWRTGLLAEPVSGSNTVGTSTLKAAYKTPRFNAALNQSDHSAASPQSPAAHVAYQQEENVGVPPIIRLLLSYGAVCGYQSSTTSD